MTDETKQVLEVVKEMFEALNAKIDGLGTEMKTRMAKIETTLENDTNKRIQLLAEGYQSVGAIPEKMEQLSEEVGAIRRVRTLGRRGHHQEGCHDAFRGA